MDHTTLPVINFERLDQPETLRALDCACRNWGAFVLAGHPLRSNGADRILQRAREFFHLDSTRKQEVRRTRDNPCGYYDAELTANTLDCKEIYDFSPAELGNQPAPWPADLPAFRNVLTDHYSRCVEVSMALLEAISYNLGSPFHKVAAAFRPGHTSFLRLNYYPVTESSGNDATTHFGVNAHTDSGALTLLLQDDNAGLEVFRDGQWYGVSGGSLVVNLGDVLQVWSNDRYTAPLHRVVASSRRERLSVPFFFNPSFDTVYQPLETTVDHKHPPAYRPISWEEFRRLRAAGDYADYGEEVQIHQYRTETAQ